MFAWMRLMPWLPVFDSGEGLSFTIFSAILHIVSFYLRSYRIIGLLVYALCNLGLLQCCPLFRSPMSWSRSCAEAVRKLCGSWWEFMRYTRWDVWGYFLGSFSTPSTLQYSWCIIMDDFTLVSHSWQLNGMHCWSWHLLRFGFATTHILYASSTVADSPHTYLLL